MSTRGLQLCGITTDGKLWFASGSGNESGEGVSWSRWEEVQPSGTTNAAHFVSVACATRYVEDTEESYLCAVTQDGRLLYTSRVSPQDWQPFVDLRTRIQGNWDTFQVQDVTLDQPSFDVCVIVRTNSGERHILHTVRHFDETWDDFEDVTDLKSAGLPGAFTNISCANILPQPQLREELHLGGATEDGRLWYTLRSRRPDGSFSWLPFANVQKLSTSDGGHVARVGMAPELLDLQGNQQLHVFTQADGEVRHTIRFVNPPRWQPTFDSLTAQAGNPGAFTSLSCTNVEGDLHVCGVTSDGKVWHTLRSSANPASWQPFEDVTAAGGTAPGTFSFISLAVVAIYSPVHDSSDSVCQTIRQNIDNDKAHLPGASGSQADQLNAEIASLQAQGQADGCPPNYYM